MKSVLKFQSMKNQGILNFNNLSGILKCASNTGELTYHLTNSVQHPGCLSSYSCGSCLFRLIVKFYRDPSHVNLCFFVTIPYFCLQGVYKPRIRCYDTSELCMKFERCLDSESKL